MGSSIFLNLHTQLDCLFNFVKNIKMKKIVALLVGFLTFSCSKSNTGKTEFSKALSKH
jgi:hypothetical protein